VIRTLIVDDQTMIRVGIRAILEAQDDITVVGEAENGRLGVERSRSLRPDVVLMDVRMPVLDGLAATRALLEPERTEGHTPRVLMLTTFDLDDYIYAALQAGASGFLLKRASAERLIDAVQTLAAGDALLDPAVTRDLVARFVAPTGWPAAAPQEPRLAGLTSRERHVLHLVAEGYTNAEIAGLLSLAESTVKTHVKRILAKIDARDRAQAVVVAYRGGLMYPDGGT